MVLIVYGQGYVYESLDRARELPVSGGGSGIDPAADGARVATGQGSET